jgi:hypothetical protein
MYLVGSYLFSGEDLAEHLTARRAEAVQAAAAVAPDDIAARGRDAVLRDLYARFVIPVTQMHVDRAAFENERPLSDDEREAIGVKPEDADTYKAISISIPYSGYALLFTGTPTVYSANQPQAEVRSDDLLVTYLLAEVEEMQLENNFKRQIALIERTLEVTQWQAMAFNEQLMDVLADALPAPAGA